MASIHISIVDKWLAGEIRVQQKPAVFVAKMAFHLYFVGLKIAVRIWAKSRISPDRLATINKIKIV